MRLSTILCWLHIAGPLAASAFALRHPVATLSFLNVIGGRSPTILYDTKAESSLADAGVPAVSAQPVTTVDAVPETKRRNFTKLICNQEMQLAASVFSGSVLTFALNNFVSLGPIKAASALGMVAAMLLPEKMALAALCGSFAGMARHAVIPGVFASVVLGAVCAVTMTLFDRKKWLVGVGGRLGFIAQLACTLQFLVSSLFLSLPGAKLVGSYPPAGKILSELLPTCIFTVVGALLMSAFKEIFASYAKKTGVPESVTGVSTRLSTSVAAVSATGLIMSLFPVTIAGPAFCGSVLAMSSPVRIETYGGLVGASLIGGISQLLLAGVLLGGWGGKLGTAATVGVVLYKKLTDVLSRGYEVSMSKMSKVQA